MANPKTNERGRVTTFVLVQQDKIKHHVFGPCFLQVTLVWLLMALLTMIPAARTAFETAVQDQNLKAVICFINIFIAVVFGGATFMAKEHMPWNWVVQLIYVVEQCLMLTAMDVLGHINFALAFCGFWWLVLLSEVILTNEGRSNSDAVSNQHGWSFRQLLSPVISYESIACPYVMIALATTYVTGGHTNPLVLITGVFYIGGSALAVSIVAFGTFISFYLVYVVLAVAIVQRLMTLIAK